MVAPSSDRDGYLGRLRVIKAGHGLIDYWQATGLSDISLRSIPAAASTVPLARSACAETRDSLPIERVEAHHLYEPVLLSHYFSGLKEFNPLKAFVGFYNVLEYYFEEAPLLLGRAAPYRAQSITLCDRPVGERCRGEVLLCHPAIKCARDRLGRPSHELRDEHPRLRSGSTEPPG